MSEGVWTGRRVVPDLGPSPVADWLDAVALRSAVAVGLEAKAFGSALQAAAKAIGVMTSGRSGAKVGISICSGDGEGRGWCLPVWM
jgi:hypothetical protein